MNFKRALNKEQTTCINGIFVLFVFLSHFGQYETMPWNNLLLAIGQLMLHHSCSIRDMALWNKLKEEVWCILMTCQEKEY